MARFSGAAVLLILVATVSVYTCAIFGGAALGRALETTAKAKQPANSLQVSVRGVAECFAKELWGGGDSEGGRDHASVDNGAARASPARGTPRANTVDEKRFVVVNPTLGSARQKSGGDDVRGAVRPRHTNFSREITRAPNSPRGVIKVGPWGGSGGQPFYTRGTSVPRLRSITLYHSDAIHVFSYEYFQAGVRRTQGPLGGHFLATASPNPTLFPYEQINLSWDEHLTAVEGTFGHCRSVSQVVITSLTFHTDKGRTYGPYGNKAGTPFSIPAANGCIVGFWGRSGWLLDAIGVYITPCPVYKAAS